MFLFKTGNVFSNSNIFYVDNIIINNKNNQSKEALLNKAFKEGFEKLVKKILLRKDSELVLKTNLMGISALKTNLMGNLALKTNLMENSAFKKI